jgi:peptide/nickel transport system substrate-binding protein
MLTCIGIRTTVAATPRAVLFPASARLESSPQMSGWGSLSGETGYILATLVHSNDTQRRMGGSNRTLHANPQLDALIRQGSAEMDEERRRSLLVEAMETAIRDYATIPVVSLDTIRASRRGRVSCVARADEETNVLEMRRVTR